MLVDAGETIATEILDHAIDDRRPVSVFTQTVEDRAGLANMEWIQTFDACGVELDGVVAKHLGEADLGDAELERGDAAVSMLHLDLVADVQERLGQSRPLTLGRPLAHPDHLEDDVFALRVDVADESAALTVAVVFIDLQKAETPVLGLRQDVVPHR